ncbi:sialate O-acetylesterase [Pseudoroseicyclus sp. H15]
MIGPGLDPAAARAAMTEAVPLFVFGPSALMYQDAAETQPVVADGDPVAVVYATGRPQLAPLSVANAGFDSDLAGWAVANGTAVWLDGKARVQRTSTTASLAQGFSLQAGLRYRIMAEAAWVSGGSCSAALVLRAGEAWTTTNLASVALAPGASGQLVLDYTPAADGPVHLHLSITSASGVVDFDDVTLTADPRLKMVTDVPSRRPLWRSDGVRHWLEFDGIDDCLELNLQGYGEADAAGGLWAAYRPLSLAGGFVWCAGALTESATALAASAAGDSFRIGGEAGNVMDAGLHDKAAALVWDRGAGTGLFGREGALTEAAIGSESAPGALVVGARLNGSPASPLAMRLYGLATMQGAVPASLRERTSARVAALGRHRPGRRLRVLLVGGQSNADGRVALGDGPAWLQDGVVDGVSCWTGTRLEGSYWLNPAGPEGNGASFVTSGSAGCFGFADVAAKELAAAMDDLVICRVTEGGTAVDPGINPRGSWHADDVAIPAGTPRLLAALEARYAALLAWAGARGIEVEPLALLWHQGEASAASSSAVFQAQTEAVFACIRAFTGAPELPVISGTVSHASAQYAPAIEAAMQAIAASDPAVVYRDNSAETLFDGLHFDAAGALAVGAQLSLQLLEMIRD